MPSPPESSPPSPAESAPCAQPMAYRPRNALPLLDQPRAVFHDRCARCKMQDAGPDHWRYVRSVGSVEIVGRDAAGSSNDKIRSGTPHPPPPDFLITRTLKPHKRVRWVWKLAPYRAMYTRTVSDGRMYAVMAACTTSQPVLPGRPGFPNSPGRIHFCSWHIIPPAHGPATPRTSSRAYEPSI